MQITNSSVAAVITELWDYLTQKERLYSDEKICTVKELPLITSLVVQYILLPETHFSQEEPTPFKKLLFMNQFTGWVLVNTILIHWVFWGFHLHLDMICLATMTTPTS